MERYAKISEFEDMEKGWAYHDLTHVKNVARLVGVLLNKLGYESGFIEEAQIAAVLHDVGAVEGKKNHSLRSYEFAKRYFASHEMELQHEEMLLEAIRIHSDGFESENMMALTLILSDKLDITHTRLAKEGYHINGLKELQYMKNIAVDIQENKLQVRFESEDKMNREELEAFYFMEKVFKAIVAFARKVDLEPEVYLNDEKWNAFYVQLQATKELKKEIKMV